MPDNSAHALPSNAGQAMVPASTLPPATESAAHAAPNATGPAATGPAYSDPGIPAAHPWATRGGGPVVPTESALAAQHPLPAPGARLTGGLLHAWQRRNAIASMPLALHQLVAAGNLANLQLAIDASDGQAATPFGTDPAHDGTAPIGTAPGGAAPTGTAPDQASHTGIAPTGAARPVRRIDSVTPAAELGYHGPVFMDSDIYKTLEAIGWELETAKNQNENQTQDQTETQEQNQNQPDAEAFPQALADFAATAVGLLARVQRPDGYLNSYIQASGEPRYRTLASSHEMYCAGHLIQAAIALARGAGEPAAMDVATRLADHLVKEFAGQRNGLDGHPIIETALVELYRETGTTAYRDLAKQFVDQRGHGLAGDSGYGRRYLQDHLEVRQRTTEVGHAVRALYLEAGVADVAAETSDEELLASSRTRWDDMIATKTYLTGGNGSRHNDEAFGDRFELPPDRAYNETCAAIASFQWSWRLLLATGDPRYADHMERILFNGFAGAINTPGDRFFYVNPLQRRADHYERDDPGRRREWFKTACCPPNIMRLLASLQHYLATSDQGTLYIHQYATARIAGAGLDIEVDTDYPWDGEVTLRVLAAPDGREREIALRVPAWSASAGLRVNDSSERWHASAPPYLRVRRAWRPGDEVRLRLDMTPRWTYPDHRVDAVRGCAAIERGPLVYCLEQAGQAARLDELAVVPGTPLTERPATLPGIGRTIEVTAEAVRVPDGGDNASRRAVTAVTAVTAVAIPYFQWDNRGPGAMRVWIPVAPPAAPAPS